MQIVGVRMHDDGFAIHIRRRSAIQRGKCNELVYFGNASIARNDVAEIADVTLRAP